MMISPTSPWGSSFSPVSRSTILISVSGTGMPTVPGFISPPQGVTVAMGAVSVWP